MDQTSPPRSTAFTRASRQAWPLLLLTTFFWGGNVVAARWAVGEISPVMLVSLRWAIVMVVVLASVRGRFLPMLQSLRPHWRFLLLAGTLGLTMSNSMLYVGARYTSGINIAIMQGVLPVLVLVGARLLWGVQVGFLRAVGVAVTLVGILLMVCEGDFARLAELRFNFGDLLNFVGAALYAVFTLALRQRPPLPGFTFFVGVALAALVSSLPALIAEWAFGAMTLPTWKGLGVLLYVAIFASILGQLFWIRAVELIGPGRTGVFQNLVPVIGAILSVLLLREAFHWYHAAALALVLAGLMISERLGKAV
jgi:drug/metabolite transporter (DMT)-like permease